MQPSIRGFLWVRCESEQSCAFGVPAECQDECSEECAGD